MNRPTSASAAPGPRIATPGRRALAMAYGLAIAAAAGVGALSGLALTA